MMERSFSMEEMIFWKDSHASCLVIYKYLAEFKAYWRA